MKKHIFNRLAVAALIMLLAATGSFAGTESERNASGSLNKELDAQEMQEKSQAARPKKAWRNARRNLDAQAEVVAAAQKKYDDAVATKNKGSLGFFEHEGSTEAANIIKNRVATQNNDTWGNTNVGDANDATSLENMKNSLNLIQEGNDLRASDNHSTGVNKNPLKVTDEMMAMAQTQANASANRIEHSFLNNVSENLAWGARDPYRGWYDEEKALYESGNTSYAGHYYNLINPDDDKYTRYGTTGFAIGTNSKTYGYVYSQTFGYTNGSGTEYTVDEYRTRLDNYCTAIENEISAARTALNQAIAYQNELIANGGISNAEKKAIQDTLATDKEELITLNHPKSGNTFYLGDTIELRYEVYDTWEYYYTSPMITVCDNKGRLVTTMNNDVASVNEWTAYNGSVHLDRAKFNTGTYDLWIKNVPCYSDGTPVEGWESWENIPSVHIDFVTTRSVNKEVKRVYGSTRYQTAILQAKELKALLKVNKFDTIIVATGTNYADALSGAYLGFTKKAPILLVDGNKDRINDVRAYVRNNLKTGGTVYLLGGEAVVSGSVTEGLSGVRTKRLYGATRYETNIEILKEAGVSGSEKLSQEVRDLMICDGNGFADSLSASAAKRPILLVNKSLNDEQRKYLKTLTIGRYYLVGGTGVLPTDLEKEIKDKYGNVIRLGGKDRYETSIKVAEALFSDPNKAVLAYALNFPDGLCGGTLAAYMDAPVLLVHNNNKGVTSNYTKREGIKSGVVLGGPTLISDPTSREIFNMKDNEDLDVSTN